MPSRISDEWKRVKYRTARSSLAEGPILGALLTVALLALTGGSISSQHPSGAFSPVPAVMTVDYVTFTCTHGEVTLNGSLVCHDQSNVKVGWGPSTGHYFWYNVAAVPDAGYRWSSWSVAGGVCPPTCPGSATTNPVVLSDMCPRGQGCDSGTIIATFNPIPAPSTSYNWAGYVVTGSTGAFTYVTGSWIQPTMTCSSSYNADVLTWAGLDGATGATPEQGGTAGWCENGVASYSAWYENPTVGHLQNISLTVVPGDTYYVGVTYTASSGEFLIEIVALTQGIETPIPMFTESGALRNSAECVTERAQNSDTGQYTNLADFGTAEFGEYYTGSGAVACTAGSSGQSGAPGTTGPLGYFSTVTEYEMIAISGTTEALLAIPGALSSGGSSFAVTWSAPYA